MAEKGAPLKENQIPQNPAFGFQLLLDLYNCRPGVCDDLNLCYQFLDKIVDDLGMAKQAPPNIFRSPADQFPDKAGLSGWAPLIESSVVIHTLTLTNFISVDIYCCKAFDLEFAKDFCRRFFEPQRMDEQYIERGKDYYKTETNYHSLTVNQAGAPNPQITLTGKDSVRPG